MTSINYIVADICTIFDGAFKLIYIIVMWPSRRAETSMDIKVHQKDWIEKFSLTFRCMEFCFLEMNLRLAAARLENFWTGSYTRVLSFIVIRKGEIQYFLAFG